MKKYVIDTHILLWLIFQIGMMNAQASTYGYVTIPSKATPYCDYIPLDFVENDKAFTTLHNRIWVKQPVTFTVTSPKYFGGTWFSFGENSLTGLNIIYKNTIIKPTKFSENEYQYSLPMLKSGDVYEFVDELKTPTKGLKICVN